MNFAIFFSGQGVQNLQHVDELLRMAEELQVTDTLKQHLPKLFSVHLTEHDLYQNDFAQPFIFALQWCRWQQIQALLEETMAFSGYSLGELSALCCSTATDFSHGLQLAQRRAELMSKATQQPSGLMAVQGINLNVLEPYLQSTETELSIKLNDSSFVVGGFEANLQHLARQLETVGIRSMKRLNVSIPSHTSLMDLAVPAYQAELEQHSFSRLKIPIISGSGGHKYFQTKDAMHALIDQMNHAIDWDLCLSAVQENQPDIVLEIGPGNALSKMLLERQPNLIVRAVDDFKSRSGLEAWLAKQQDSP